MPHRICICYLPSTINTVALSKAPIVQSSGKEVGLIVTLNVSLPSIKLLSFIGTSNGTLVVPAGNVTVYGPES